jgi:succinate dehydrogenase / fumarate reductase flavoprotein subunit
MTVEIREGRGVGPDKDHINLHLEHLEPDLLAERLPGISETAQIFAGVDVTQEPIPVLPTVHYNMGGIPTNFHGEVINPTDEDPDRVVQGLMAIGEAACVSVHGANRLGCNSLLDIIVFGRAAALRTAELVKAGSPKISLPKEAGEEAIAHLDKTRNAKGGTPVARIRDKMQRVMQNNCAVFRTSKVLEEGVRLIDACAEELADMSVTDRSMIWNSDLVEALELENLMSQALAALHSAEARKESRGAHAHEDHPDRDDENWMKHTAVYLDGVHDVRITYRPVHLNTLSDEVDTFPPKERVY